MIGEMVGSQGSKGAIVYGLYSFFDKITNGLIIYYILVAFKIQKFIFFRILNNLQLEIQILLDFGRQLFQVLQVFFHGYLPFL